MSGGSGPPPKGQVVGIFKCVYKSDAEDGIVTVTLNSSTRGTAVLRRSEEDAAYYVVGESYELSTSKP